MKLYRTRRGTAALLPTLLTLAILLLLGAATPAEAGQTIVVMPTPGNPTASGQALRDAVNGISTTSWGTRYLVKLDPGVYDLGSTPLQMKSWVDIEGSGRYLTLITGTSSATLPTSGIVHGADHAELRSLTVQAAGSHYAIAVYTTADTGLRDVYLIATGTSNCWGLRSVGGDVVVEDVKIYVNCSSYNSGISVVSSGKATLQRIRVRAHGASFVDGNVGIWFDGSALPYVFHDLALDVGNSSTGPGTGVRIGNLTGGWLEIINTHIHTSGGRGIYADQPMSLKVRHSNIVQSEYGIRLDAGSYLFVHNSLVAGTENTIFAPSTTVKVGASQLDGGPVVGGTGKCAGVYDESFNFYPSTCP